MNKALATALLLAGSMLPVTTCLAAPTAEQLRAEKALQEKYPGYAGVDADYLHAGPAAIERWMDAKLGLRIHWGVYSMLGVEASWALDEASPEFQRLYHTLYQSFDPVGFNAEEWMAIMKRGGIKYFTITAMHCDGFCLWPTERVLDGYKRPVGGGESLARGIGPVEPAKIRYSIAETPYHQDILAQLAAAGRRNGIGVGFYFSHENWLDPDFAWHRFDASNVGYTNPRFDKASDPARWQRFIDKERLQLRELASNYGPLDDLSFDCSWPAEAFNDLADITKMVRRLQPQVMMRNRGIQQYGDYGTPEQSIPADSDPRAAQKAAGPEGRVMPWQLIYHVGEAWSYLPNDRYESKEWMLATLIDVVAKGGNVQFGFGPPATGQWQQAMIERLTYLGDWLQVNGEAIYATRAGARWNEGANIRFTCSKDQRFIYVISLQWPGQRLVVRNVRPKPSSAITLLGVAEPLKWQSDAAGLTIELPDRLQTPANRPCQQAWAFRVEGAFNTPQPQK